MNDIVKSVMNAKDGVIWDISGLLGLNLNRNKIKSVLLGNTLETNMDEVLYCVGMKKAWEYMLNNLEEGSSLEYRFIQDLDNYIHPLYKRGFPKSMFDCNRDLSKVYDCIYKRVEELNNIEDPEERALKIFCFVLTNNILVEDDLQIAWLVANKILIENNVGVLLVLDGFMPAFTKKFNEEVSDYYFNGGDTSGIIKLLKSVISKNVIRFE